MGPSKDNSSEPGASVVLCDVAEPMNSQPDSGSLSPKGPFLHSFPDWREVSFPKSQKGPWVQEACCFDLRLPEGPKPGLALCLPGTLGRYDFLPSTEARVALQFDGEEH